MLKFLKRIKWKIALPVICFCIIAIVILILCLQKPKQISVTVIQTPYNVLCEINEPSIMNVGIYVNQKNSYYTDSNKISSVSLTSGDTLYRLKLLKIIDGEKEVNLYDQDYYLYYFKLQFDVRFLSNYSDELENCILHLSYSNAIESNLEIGSLSLYQYDKTITNDSSDIAITQTKSITNYNGNTNLYGIVLGIRNFNNDTSIKIKEIEVLESSINRIDGNLINYKKEINLSNEVSNNIIDYIPEYPNVNSIDNTIEIQKKSMKLVTIPIIYNHQNSIDCGEFGLKVTYEIQEGGETKTKEYYFQKFVFFDSIYHVKEDELKFYSYANQ